MMEISSVWRDVKSGIQFRNAWDSCRPEFRIQLSTCRSNELVRTHPTRRNEDRARGGVSPGLALV